ncbi:hypothetical protein J6590_090531 [Homalodisca vitripennis]|nr:hypothetical protein J6590_090531 [Homalodisca vitripennis]
MWDTSPSIASIVDIPHLNPDLGVSDVEKMRDVPFGHLRSSSPTTFVSLHTNMTPDFRTQVRNSITFQMLHIR